MSKANDYPRTSVTELLCHYVSVPVLGLILGLS